MLGIVIKQYNLARSSYLAGFLVEIAVSVGVAAEAPRSRTKDELEIGARRHNSLQIEHHKKIERKKEENLLHFTCFSRGREASNMQENKSIHLRRETCQSSKKLARVS